MAPAYSPTFIKMIYSDSFSHPKYRPPPEAYPRNDTVSSQTPFTGPPTKSSTSRLKPRNANIEDLDAIVSILLAAFEVEDETLTQQTVEMYLANEVGEWKVMVVETPTLENSEAAAEVVAVAVWQMAEWDPEEMIVVNENDLRPYMYQERYCAPQFLLKDARKKHWARDRDDLIELVTLATHPIHQRCGAGKALVDWGILEANLFGPNLAIVVFASKVGREFFSRLGFWGLEEMVGGIEETAMLWPMVYDPAVNGIKEF